MVSGGTVRGDASSLEQALSNYSSDISGLSGSWKGSSHDSLTSKAENFVSEYQGTIKGEMEAFATACDLYEKYIRVKREKEQFEAKNGTLKETQSDGTKVYWDCSKAIGECTSEMNDLKGQIESNLATASASTLTATATSGGSSGGGGGNSSAKSSTASVADNLTVSQKSGYVFPFEKGVDAPVTSGVGPRWGTNHNGTDIGVPIGTEIHSLSSGTVLHAGEAQGYGQWVQIQQDDGNIVTYGHVSKYDYFQEGDRVNAGDLVALSGNEGDSTGPHLHLQIEDADGNLLDSEELFEDVW